MVLLTVRTHGPYYTNNGYLLCARASCKLWKWSKFSYTNTMVNYRATDTDQ